VDKHGYSLYMMRYKKQPATGYLDRVTGWGGGLCFLPPKIFILHFTFFIERLGDIYMSVCVCVCVCVCV
jgi:hypothetical protein